MSITVSEPRGCGAGSDRSEYEVLYALAHTVLDAIVGVYEQAGVDLPARRYVHFGGVAADCEQLTVQVDQLYSGTPGGDANAVQRCNGPRTAVLSVQLFRPEPTQSGTRGGPPTPEQLDAAARQHLTDAVLLLDAAGEADNQQGQWGTGYIAEVSPVDASGGFVGIAMALSMQV